MNDDSESLDSSADSGEARDESVGVPLFPLPGVFLLPNTLAPLHIFEPRYRQMVDDLLDGRGELILGTIPFDHKSAPIPLASRADGATGETPEDRTPVLPIGGLGRLQDFEKLDDGRYVIVVLGVSRVILREIPRQRLYRQALIELLDDVPEPANSTVMLRQRLTAALHERGGAELELSEELTVGNLADMLTLYLKIPAADMERIYACPDVARRAQFVLEIAGA